jgi:hypothetical protein
MAKSRKEKSSILDEYCGNTGQNRKYVIRKINSSISLVSKRRGGKKVVYDGYVRAALTQVWEIFDYPCGQRLAPLLETGVYRLRKCRKLLIAYECQWVVPIHGARQHRMKLASIYGDPLR